MGQIFVAFSEYLNFKKSDHLSFDLIKNLKLSSLMMDSKSLSTTHFSSIFFTTISGKNYIQFQAKLDISQYKKKLFSM